GAHAGELCDLLAAQTRRPPPAAVGKAEVLGFQRLAAVAQEVGELLAAPLARARDLTERPLAIVSVFGDRRGRHVLYQDKPASTTITRHLLPGYPLSHNLPMNASPTDRSAPTPNRATGSPKLKTSSGQSKSAALARRKR